MKMKLAAMGLVAGVLLLPISGYAADTDATSPKAFVKDSVITTKIKTKLAEEKLSSLVKISVDTDNSGKVNLSGTAANQGAVDRAMVIARAVHGVTSVDNNIRIVADK